MPAGAPTIEALLKQVAALEGQADLDRLLIIELQAQGVLDRTSIAGLEKQHGADQASIEDLEAQGAIDRAKIENLQVALTTARRIGAAIGILMANHKITETQAFELLRLISQSTNRKLRELADEVVETGLLPAMT